MKITWGIIGMETCLKDVPKCNSLIRLFLSNVSFNSVKSTLGYRRRNKPSNRWTILHFLVLCWIHFKFKRIIDSELKSCPLKKNALASTFCRPLNCLFFKTKCLGLSSKCPSTRQNLGRLIISQLLLQVVIGQLGLYGLPLGH